MEQRLPPESDVAFAGVIANRHAKAPPGFVLRSENLDLVDGRWRLRPGLRRLGSVLEQDTPIQGVFSFEELDSTRHLVAFCGGNLYEYDWDADSWSSVDVGSVDIASTGPIQATPFRGRLVWTDGVNRPVMWEYPSTFTVLTAAPVSRGVGVYYSRVFFYGIPSAENVFEWSEPGDATTGYFSEGYDWEFVQTDAGGITGMAFLNSFFNVLKEDSVAMVSGAVEDQFETDAVREGVSTTQGCVSAYATVVAGEDVYSVSQRGPIRIVGGQRLVDLSTYEDRSGSRVDRFAEPMGVLDRSRYDEIFGAFDRLTRQVFWTWPEDGVGGLSRLVVYQIEENTFKDYRFGIDVSCLGNAESPGGQEYLVIGDRSGNVWVLDPESRNDGDLPIRWGLDGRLYGIETPNMLKRMSEVRLGFEVRSSTFEAGMGWHDQDGERGGERTLALSQSTPRVARYTRGFGKVVRSAVGWYLAGEQEGADFDLTTAVAAMTAAGSEESF